MGPARAVNGSAGNEPAGTETGRSGFDGESGRFPIATRRLYSGNALTEEGDREMPRRTLATRLFDELAQRLALRRAPRTSDPETAEIPGRLPDAGNGRTAAPEPTVGTLFHLVSLGVVATATVAVSMASASFCSPIPGRK